MAEPTLQIQYFDKTTDLVLHAADGTTHTVTKAKDDASPTTANLTRPYLLSPDFQAAVKAGNIAFLAPASPSAEAQRLAIDVMRTLLGSLGTEMLTTSRRMLTSEASLEKHRDAYNASHRVTTLILHEGKTLVKGATRLAGGAEALLVPAVERAEVDAAKKSLEKLDQDHISMANGSTPMAEKDLLDYLEKRKKLVAALAAAEAKLEAAQASLANEFKATAQGLKEAAWVMTHLEPADIANAITWTWTLPPMT